MSLTGRRHEMGSGRDPAPARNNLDVMKQRRPHACYDKEDWLSANYQAQVQANVDFWLRQEP